MKSKFQAYLDDFHRITLLIPYTYRNDICNSFYITNGEDFEDLQILQIHDIGYAKKYILKSYAMLHLNRDYSVYDDRKQRAYLKIGAISRTSLFESLYTSDSHDFGVTYTKEETMLKLWTPVAKEIEVELISPEGKKMHKDMTYMHNGEWEIHLKGDFDSYKYRYRVRINEEFTLALDPYGISSDANGQYNYIIDPKKCYQEKHPSPKFSEAYTDMIVCEAHVRDLTSDPSIKVNHRGQYLGLCESPKTSTNASCALEHIALMGYTHIQLQPVYDFGGVDELKPTESYNWGYNPVQYNVPEGSYSSNPNDPYARINELKMVIDRAHELGLRVTLDVVYNHVYEMEDFSFQKLVPGYFFQYDERGIRTNSSGCGNDVDSRRKMVRKFIIDSCVFWKNFYHIDGFRFDLMGILDKDTLNEIEKIMYHYDKEFVIYGEGWNMPCAIPESDRASMLQSENMPYVAYFNDTFRNNIKDFVKGKPVDKSLIANLVLGKQNFETPAQSINYVECHDNYALLDDLRTSMVPNDYLYAMHRLATSIVLVSQGIPFLDCGQEFLRTKKGVENSYKSGDSINMVEWQKKDMNFVYVKMVRDLIEIRKKYDCFHLRNRGEIKKYSEFLEKKSDKSHYWFSYLENGMELLVLIMNDFKDYYVKDYHLEMIFDGDQKCQKIQEDYHLNQPGVYMFIRRDTYGI